MLTINFLNSHIDLQIKNFVENFFNDLNRINEYIIQILITDAIINEINKI